MPSTRSRSCPHGRASRLALTAAVMAAAAPWAAGDTWDNSFGNAQWSTDLNWVDNSEPASTAEPVFFPNPGTFYNANITLSAGEVCSLLDFNAVYNFNGGTLNVGGAGGAIDVAPSVTATINSVLNGTQGLTKSGSGTLTLGSVNTFTGNVTLNAGTLSIDASSRLGNTGNQVVINAGTLQATAGMFGMRSVTLNSSSAAMTVAGDLLLPSNENKMLNVTAGGSVSNVNATIGLTDTATVTGVDSTWTNSGFLSIAGSLTVADGGSVSSSSGEIFSSRGAPTATVTGAGSLWSLGGNLEISGIDDANCALNIINGGTVMMGGNIFANANGTLLLDGGTLDMQNHTIGPILLNSLNLRSGTLKNVAKILGPGLVKTSSGTLTLDGTNTYTSGTTISAGTLQIGNGAASGSIVGNVTNNGTLAFNRSDDVSFTGLISGGGGVVKLAANTLTLTANNTYTGGTTVQAGTLQVTRLHQDNAVNITGGTLRVLHSDPTGPDPESGDNAFVSQPSALGISAGATLDLTNNDLILDYSGDSPAATIESLVASGYNVIGDWQGDGITSSIAAVNGNYVLAVADNALLAAPFGSGQGGPHFSGVDVDLTTVLVKFTHRVDINLDGLVSPDDAAIFGTNYDESITSGFTFAMGDVDYDGACTPNDAAIFGTFYDESLSSLPEPAGVGMVACALVHVLRRRHHV